MMIRSVALISGQTCFLVGTVASLLLSPPAARGAVLASYPFTGNSSASTDTDANTTASSFTDGAGVNYNYSTAAGAGNPLPGIFVPFSQTGDSLTTAVNFDDYLTFTVTPNAGYEVDFSSLVFDHSVFGSDDMLMTLRTSRDGFAANASATISTIGESFTTATISLSSTAFQNLTTATEFRLYLHDTVSTGPTTGLRMDNITLNGTAAQILTLGFTPDVYGIKSTNASPSTAPTVLFGIDAAGTQVDVAPLRINGGEIDADGLALSAAGDLYAFRLQSGNSTLISIDEVTGAAMVVGSTLAGRDIRGAAFDYDGALRALDAAANVLLEVDPATGSLIGSPIALTLGGNPFDLYDGTDLTQDHSGAYHVVSGQNIFGLNIETGELTQEYFDTGQLNTGAAISPLTPGALLTLETVSNDDIYSYDLADDFTRTVLMPNFYSAVAAGRGDLAALPFSELLPAPVPEPASVWWGLGVTAAGLMRRARCSRRCR